MGKVVCFGEIMMRLAPPGYQRFSQMKSLEVVYGGAEANVAVSLAIYGIDASYITKIPQNPIGDACIGELTSYHVDTSGILRGGERLGIYFIEKGAAMRPSKVVYDRKYSSFAEARPDEFHWDEIFDEGDWFHFTGITPALGDNASRMVLEACKAAKKKGVAISCDLNFRRNLWSAQKAGTVMGQLMEYVDILITNEGQLKDLFNMHASGQKSRMEENEEMALKASKTFGIEKVAMTLRESLSAFDHNWSAIYFDGKNFFRSKEYHIHIVDRIGGGDAFSAGLLYGLIQGYSSQDIIEFAAAASALKHTIEGDFNLVTQDEVESLMKGEGTGRVQR